MSAHESFRLIMALALGAAFAGVVYWSAFSKTRKADPSFRSRYDPILSPFYLLLFLVGIAAMCLAMGQNYFIAPFLMGLVLDIAAYYAVLLLLLPLLRKVFRPSTVAALWLLPNFLYFTCYGYMMPGEPRLVLPMPVNVTYWLLPVWGLGFLVILGRAVIGHLTYRKKLLRAAVPVSEPDILAVWDDEKYTFGLEKAKLSLVRSAATTTPLSIGIWRRTTRVVLPEQAYTSEELRLIFRHELIHIRRQDPATKFFLTFCQAACWFNPLMWMAMRKCADDLELGCDELVLTDADSGTRETYARLVLSTAGDERGFTTCLSVKANSLRYRLRGIVSGRRKLVGGVLVGLLITALLLGNGLVALAYSPTQGKAVIFRGQSADFQPTRIFVTPGKDSYQYDFYTCADVPALKGYLSELTLYRVSGMYDPQDGYLYVAMNGDSVSVRLYEHFVMVQEWDDFQLQNSCLYYSPEPLDLTYLNSLLKELP